MEINGPFSSITAAAARTALGIPALGIRTVKDPPWGAVGDGSTNDATAIKAAIDALKGYAVGNRVLVQAGAFALASIVLTGSTLTVQGHGLDKTVFKPSGTLTAALVSLQGITRVKFKDMSFDTRGSGYGAFDIDANCQDVVFENVGFACDHSGDAVTNRADTTKFVNCFWYLPNRNTWAINFTKDANPNPKPAYYGNNHIVQGGTVYGGPAGSGGNGVRITQYNLTGIAAGQSASLDPKVNRVEGVYLLGLEVISDGLYNVQIGNSLAVYCLGCILDQTSQYAVWVGGGAEDWAVQACYLGGIQPTTGKIGVYCAPDCGPGGTVNGNTLKNLDIGVQCDATADSTTNNVTTPGKCVDDITITSNTFSYMGKVCVILDSVQRALVGFNKEFLSNPSWGSVGFKTSKSAGICSFLANAFPNTTLTFPVGTYVLKGFGNIGCFDQLRGSRCIVPFATMGNTIAANTTVFVGQGVSQYENAVSFPVPYGCVASQLQVASNASPGSGQSYTCILQNKGGNTAVAAVISGTNQGASDTTRSTAFTQGDTISLKVTSSAGAATTIIRGSVMLEAP